SRNSSTPSRQGFRPSMPTFPSKLPFAAFLQYSPRGTTPTSLQSKNVTLAIKRDGFIGRVRVIDFAARRIREERINYPFLNAYLNGSVTVVPAPRSSPQKDPRALWPALRICQSLENEGCAGNVLACLQRIKPVMKSSTAGASRRPNPDTHYGSID